MDLEITTSPKEFLVSTPHAFPDAIQALNLRLSALAASFQSYLEQQDIHPLDLELEVVQLDLSSDKITLVLRDETEEDTNIYKGNPF